MISGGLSVRKRSVYGDGVIAKLLETELGTGVRLESTILGWGPRWSRKRDPRKNGGCSFDDLVSTLDIEACEISCWQCAASEPLKCDLLRAQFPLTLLTLRRRGTSCIEGDGSGSGCLVEDGEDVSAYELRTAWLCPSFFRNMSVFSRLHVCMTVAWSRVTGKRRAIFWFL